MNRRLITTAWCCGYFLISSAGATPTESSPSFGQTTAALKIPAATVFSTPTTHNPLTTDSVEAITQDPRGFLWIGTVDGLNRFDGYEYVPYYHSPDDPKSLPDNFVQDLVTAPDGTLWVGTLKGLARYDYEQDHFHNYLSDPADTTYTSLSHRSVGALHIDHKERLWVGTYWGLNLYDAENDNFIHYNPETYIERVIPVTNIQSLAEDHDGNIWVGTRMQGLVRLDPETGENTHFLHDPDEPGSLSNNEVRDILVDPQGRIWIGTYGGLDLFEPESSTFKHFRNDPTDPDSLAGDTIEALHMDDDGVLWIGTDGAGLDAWRPGTDVFVHHRFDELDPAALDSDVIRNLYEDAQGNFWLGLYSGGLQRENPAMAPFHHVRRRPGDPDSLSHSIVLSFSEGVDGDLWIGTEDGLNRFDSDGSNTIYRHDPLDPASLSAKAILSVNVDSKGRVWAGTFFGGLNRLQTDGKGFRRYEHDAENPDSPKHPGNPHIWSIYEDPDGYLWLGTFGGLDRFDPETETFKHFRFDPDAPESVANEIVWFTTHTQDGTFWVATQGGFGRLDPETGRFKNYLSDPTDLRGLPSDHISRLHETDDGMIWLATEGGGLIQFDRRDESFKGYRRPDGLPSDTVSGLTSDANGFLWITSGDSLCRFDPRTEDWLRVDPKDGLRTGTFKRNSQLTTSDGRLFFGGTRGYLHFDPADISIDTRQPSVVLTGFQLFGKDIYPGENSPLPKHISEAPSIQIDHDQSVLQFTFSALDFVAPEKSLYRYRLEGFDQDWTPASEDRTATYTNLDPGTYSFHVIAANSNGVWNNEGLELQLHIKPPYWQTYWFRGLVMVVAFALLGLFYHLRTRSIRRHNRLLRREILERQAVEEERRRLMEEMEQSNTELQSFTYTLSHDLKSPLVTIQGFVGALERDLQQDNRNAVAEDIDFIKNAAARMGTLLNELLKLRLVSSEAMDLRSIELDRVIDDTLSSAAEDLKQHDAELTVTPDLPRVVADYSRLLEVYQNLVDNAIKFRREDVPLALELGGERFESGGKAQVLCWVRDNGQGIAKEHQEQVFGLFKRLSNDNRGTGIGLGMVRRIIELHHGKIWIESEGPDKGTTIFFLLPAVG